MFGQFVNCKPQIIIVDDNSTDDTTTYIERFQELNPKIQVEFIQRRGKDKSLVNSLNDGLACALFDISLKEIKESFIIWMDADLSHPPDIAFKLFVEAYENKFDAVIASRFITGGSTKNLKNILKMRPKALGEVGDSFLAVLASTIINRYLNTLIKNGVSDQTSGFTCLRICSTVKVPILRGNYGDYFCNFFKDVFELNPDFKVFEIPFKNELRIHGYSKTMDRSFFEILRMGKFYLKLPFKKSPKIIPVF